MKQAAKQPTKQPAKQEAKKQVQEAEPAEEDADGLTPEQRRKQRLVIAGLVVSGGFFLFMVYTYLTAFFK